MKDSETNCIQDDGNDMKALNELSYRIIGAAFEVRKCLGRHFHEKTYEAALAHELRLRGMKCERQVPIHIHYKGIEITDDKRVDILVEGKIPVELKSMPFMGHSEVGQIMQYIRFGKYRLGFLMNFDAEDFCTAKLGEFRLCGGIYRLIN